MKILPFFTGVAASLAILCGSASAACFGTAALETCTDQNGNNYTVNRFGNTTMMQGSNMDTGSTWSQSSNTFGNTTVTNGMTNGRSWNETQTQFGNGFGSASGTNSRGEAFGYSCTPYGGCH